MKRFSPTYSFALLLVLLVLVSGMGIYEVFAEDIPDPEGKAPSSNIIPNFSSLLIGESSNGVLLNSDGLSGIISQNNRGISIVNDTKLSIGLIGHGTNSAGIFVTDDGSNHFSSVGYGIRGIGYGTNGRGIDVLNDQFGSVGIYAESTASYGFDVNGKLEATGYSGIFAVGNTDTGISADNYITGKNQNSDKSIVAQGTLENYTFNSVSEFGVYSDASLSWIGGTGTTFSITNDQDHDANLGTGAFLNNLEISLAFQSDTIDAPGLTAKNQELGVSGDVFFDTNKYLYFNIDKTADVTKNVSTGQAGLLLITSGNAAIQSSGTNPVTIDDNAEFQGNFYDNGKLTGKSIGSTGIRTDEFSNGTKNSVSCSEDESLMSCSAEISNTSGLTLKKVYPESDTNTCTALHSDIPAGGKVTIYAYCFSSSL